MNFLQMGNVTFTMKSNCCFLGFQNSAVIAWSEVFAKIGNGFILDTPLVVAYLRNVTHTAQQMKFSIKDFFSKCDQIRRLLWI